MTDAHAFLESFAIVLGVAAVTTVVAQRLRLPVVLGYLVAGLIVGPHFPVPLVADPPTISTLAELGVILLLFAIGLEFSLKRLVQVGAGALLIGLVEVGLMLWLGYLAARLAGWTETASIYAGATVAISSTTIIARTFNELKVRGVVRDTVFGVLIVEDVIAVVLLATLAGGVPEGGLSLQSAGSTVLRLGGFLVALVLLGLPVVPRAMKLIVRLEKKETLLVAAIGLAFVAAYLAGKLGYSVALGAFLAGTLVAESGEGHRVERLIEPVRDVFAAVFFVAVGMSIDPAAGLASWPLVLGMTLVVVLGKPIGVTVGAFLAGFRVPVALQMGISLAQIGEFSFLIAGAAVAASAAPPALTAVAVAVASITTVAAPPLIRRAEEIACDLDRLLPSPVQTVAALYGTWVAALGQSAERRRLAVQLRRPVLRLGLDVAGVLVIVIGGALVLGPVEAWLSARGLVPLAAHAALVALGLALVVPALLGLGRRAHDIGLTLALAAMPAGGRIDQALAPRRAFVALLQTATLLLIGIPLLAVIQPFLPAVNGLLLAALGITAALVVFWRQARALDAHVRAGTEVFLSALVHEDELRDAAQTRRTLEVARTMLPGFGEVTRIALGDASGSVGHTLSELDLRGRTGATVLAVRRGGESIVAPSGDDPLQEHDVLLLTGTHAAVEAARELLSAAEPPVRDEEVRQTRAFRVAQARRTAEMRVVPAIEQPAPDAR